MKKTHAIKWINALRSGKYKQTQNALCDKNGYCCLGVLNKIFPKMNLSGGSDIVLENYFKIGLRSQGGRILDGLGLKGGYSTKAISLANLNDQGYTFDEIADVIQIEYVEEE